MDLLDNLRFDPGEEGNDPAFVDTLVEGFSAYVNDAFGSSHRAHASMVGPPARLPSAAGRLLAREVEVLGSLLVAPARPFVAVVGGAKVADKLGVLRSLLTRVDTLVVGGGMAFTFLSAQGHRVGASLVDAGHVEDCRALLEESGDRILLPPTWWRSPRGDGGRGHRRAGRDPHLRVGDPRRVAGPRHRARERRDLRRRRHRGRDGVLERAHGGVRGRPLRGGDGRALATAMAETRAFSVVGGGDTVAALDHMSLGNEVGYVSTGGGASLELLEHGDLPGLEALRHAPTPRP